MPSLPDASEWRERWPNFVPAEIRCQGCPVAKPCRRDAYGIRPEAMDALQAVREALARPLRLNSAFRCAFHNSRVGGAPRSHHKIGDAFDVSVYGWTEQERAALLQEAARQGFGGTGLYRTFLHVDLGRRRRWAGPGGARAWNG